MRLSAADAHVTGGRKTRGGLASGAAEELTIMELLAGMTTNTSECAEDTGCVPGTPCASKKILVAIKEFADEEPRAPQTAPRARAPQTASREDEHLPTTGTPDGDAVRAAAKALSCTSESCVVTHPRFRSFATQRGISAQELALEMELRFKAAGPRDSLALLSNVHIDATLRRWARVFPEFFPCPFAMMDFNHSGDFFGEVDLLDVLDGNIEVDLGAGIGAVRRKSTYFGCVVNTDVSSGRGKHWVAVFVDCRGKKWSVEYFNSAGNPPPRPMTDWLARSSAKLSSRCPTSVVAVTDVDHQESQTECGLYALYYIRRRLEGTPYSFFFEKLVPDAAMTAFRRHVFRKA